MYVFKRKGMSGKKSKGKKRRFFLAL